jgi:hypothetical protein
MHQTNSTASVKSACHSIDGPSRILEIAIKHWPHSLLTKGEKKGHLQLFRNPPLKYAPVKISATDKLLKVLGNVKYLHKSKNLWPLLCSDILDDMPRHDELASAISQCVAEAGGYPWIFAFQSTAPADHCAEFEWLAAHRDRIACAAVLDGDTEANQFRVGALHRLPVGYHALWLGEGFDPACLPGLMDNIAWVITTQSDSVCLAQVAGVCRQRNTPHFDLVGCSFPGAGMLVGDGDLPNHPFEKFNQYRLGGKSVVRSAGQTEGIEQAVLVEPVEPADAGNAAVPADDATSPKETVEDVKPVELNVADDPGGAVPSEQGSQPAEIVKPEQFELFGPSIASGTHKAPIERASRANRAKKPVQSGRQMLAVPDNSDVIEAEIDEVTSAPAAGQSRFEYLNAIVSKAAKSWLAGAVALDEIRRDQLWREGGDPSFADYCRRMFGYGESYASLLISSAAVANEILALGDGTPETGMMLESHARALAKIKKPADRIRVWQNVCQCGLPTAKMIEAEASHLLKGKATTPPKPKAGRARLLEELAEVARDESSWQRVREIAEQLLQMDNDNRRCGK